jgi:hypothetical protein
LIDSGIELTLFPEEPSFILAPWASGYLVSLQRLRKILPRAANLSSRPVVVFK